MSVFFHDPVRASESLRKPAQVLLIKAEHDVDVAIKGIGGPTSWLPTAVPTGRVYSRAGWVPAEYVAKGGNVPKLRERMGAIADSLDVAARSVRDLHPVDGKALSKSLTGMAEHARGLTRIEPLHLTHQYGLAGELSSARADARAAFDLLNTGVTSQLGRGSLRGWVPLAGIAAAAGAAWLVHDRRS